MATAKQIAWRKKFAKMAKSGAFQKKAARKSPARKTNPAKKKPAKKTEVAIQINPARKVAAKRKRKVTVVRRNPSPPAKYAVKMGASKARMGVVSRHHTEASAVADAKRLSKQFPSMHVGVYG